MAKPQYIPRILSCFQEADLSKYKDSMRPMIERDMTETKKALMCAVGQKCDWTDKSYLEPLLKYIEEL